MKIYTKTGDKGKTTLVGGTSIRKNDLRLEAYGTVDELNSWVGFIISLLKEGKAVPTENATFLNWIQNKLFDLGCALATEFDAKWQPRIIQAVDVERIEAEIDRIDATLPIHNRFILPGGTKGASATQITRTVCRRAERIMVSLPENTCPSQEVSLKFINRLSDYLFVLARHINFLNDAPEDYWE